VMKRRPKLQSPTSGGRRITSTMSR
jgi:hypothetical protein